MRFLIHQLLMGKYHMRTLSMKYPTCICIPLHKTFLWKKRPCFSMVSTVCSWMQSTFCLSELSVLQAVTILVAMASRKKFWRLKLLWKSPNWPPVFSYHVPSFSLFLSEIVRTMCTVHFLTRGYAKRRNGFLLGLRYANVSLAHSGVESS